MKVSLLVFLLTVFTTAAHASFFGGETINHENCQVKIVPESNANYDFSQARKILQRKGYKPFSGANNAFTLEAKILNSYTYFGIFEDSNDVYVFEKRTVYLIIRDYTRRSVMERMAAKVARKAPSCVIKR